MNTTIFAFSLLLANLLQPPVIRPVDLRADEKPIVVESSSSTVEENAFFRRVKTTFVFTNPNPRRMAGEFEFPIPDGAVVCGYSLQIGTELVPGVVCEAEKARVAFENETRKGVDPGLVEQVKGNVWRTRIFPLEPGTPRRAEVTYVSPCADAESAEEIYERDGDDVFVASPVAPSESHDDPIACFSGGFILWDRSLSRLGKVADDRVKLARLPENGDWTLIAFSNVPELPRRFTSRAELLAAIDALVYDGGTDIDTAIETAGESPTLLFTDEIDTLGAGVLLERANMILASRAASPARTVNVRKLAPGEKMPRLAPKPSTLLATVWAARRMNDLAAQADARRGEFLALGRRYGVAGPGLSLIVLETLEQYLEHKIEPSADLAIHAEWLAARAKADDEIDAKKARAAFEARLLDYWQERVKWWNDPKPKIETPKSGLFSHVVTGNRYLGARRSEPALNAAPVEDDDGAVMCCMMAEEEPEPSAAPAPAEASTPGATVSLKPWDPQTPYLEKVKAASPEEAYAVYLAERKSYLDSPAFYLDCADFFFAKGDKVLGWRIISNLAEFRLENVALWRTMGYRLRQAEAYDEAVRVLERVLARRGEEGISFRDLALVLIERGKASKSAADLSRAAKLLHQTAFTDFGRRSGRRGNDLQVAIIALEELSGLLSWCAANGIEIDAPAFDAAYRRDLPVGVRIVLQWDADETDIDLHVLEPNGEEAFYGHRRTKEGGFVSEDVTTGYGPEEYLAKEPQRGVYKVLSNYFASHQTSLTGATVAQVVVFTDWGKKTESRRILTLRLDKPKDKVLIGEIEL